MISKDSLDKFKSIYKAEFDVDLTDAEAMEQATRLLSLCKIVLQPMPKKMLPRYKEILEDTKKVRSLS
jgi:hypothetical protein